ncbi:MAG: hypothetical protein Q8M24_21105 [Pseudolabrys sp.]|nr:hypothetical protein [Pseudolabrys sp.]MDP2297950.1 hypothetical protein [Pseudolabrys sp.]
MQRAAESAGGSSGPKQPAKYISHNENVDEPAKLVDEESVEIERETLSEGNAPFEAADDRNSQPPPVFAE